MTTRPWLLISAVVLAFLGPELPVCAATPADTVVMAKAIDDMLSLDPAEAYEPTDLEVVANCYERMVHFEPGDLTRLVGDSAMSWTVSDDGKTFTFKVRPGQRFHSGNPLTAEDMAFSLRRVVILNKAPGFLLTQLGWTSDNVGTLIRPVDADTLVLTITKNYAANLVLDLLSSDAGSVVDEKEAMAHEVNGDLGNGWLKSHDAGSGPYRLQAWKPDDSVILEADSSFQPGAPAVKRVILKHAPEAVTQRLMLEKGDADIARDLTPDQIAGLAGNPDIVVSRYPSSQTLYLTLNLKSAPLDNAKVRQALRYLVDYQGMENSFLKGQLILHQAFWPSGFFASLDDNPFRFDLNKAKQLLAEAGYPNGFEMQLDTGNTSPLIDIAQSIQHSMAEAGVKLDIVQHDYKQVLTLNRARQHQIALMRWTPDFLDPHSNASMFAYNLDNSDKTKAKTLAWRDSWYIPDLSRETEAALEEKDLDRRKQLYLDLQRKLQADSPFINLFQVTFVVAARKDVKGFVVGPAPWLVVYRLMTK